jgi:hypothetical protein
VNIVSFRLTNKDRTELIELGPITLLILYIELNQEENPVYSVQKPQCVLLATYTEGRGSLSLIWFGAEKKV